MFAVIFIPDFFLQAALRHGPERHSQPVALTDPEWPKLGVIQCNSHAQTAGVEKGISASQALARCPALLIKSRCPAQEQAASDVLLQTAYAFSPFIEATGPGICTMDLRGLRIVSNKAATISWTEKIRTTLATFHLDSRIGFAPTPDLALLAATASSSCDINIIQNVCQFLTDLCIHTLGLSAEMMETLDRWGIKTAGALVKLGKDPLAERLGPEVISIFERLAPDFIRPLKIAAMPETFSEQIEFPTEIETLEPLLFVLRRFTEQLARRIQMLYLVVAELHLKLGLTSGANYESTLKVPSPSGNAETLFRMLQTHLENVRTDAPISSLHLAAKPAKPDTHQFGLFETTLRNPNQFAETLARLEALCGPNRVGTPVPEPTLRPDAFKLKVAFSDDSRSEICPLNQLNELNKEVSEVRTALSAQERRARNVVRTRVSALQSSKLRSRSPLDPCPLPLFHGLRLRRFRPPLSAEVEFHERCPASIRSSVCNGRIVDRRGPFLASGNWWDEGRWWREEWDVQMTDGRMYRIFRTTPSAQPQLDHFSPRPSPAVPKEEREKSKLPRAGECFLEGVYD